MRYRKPLSPSDLEITHLKGSGPGGQNRNKRMSGVRVVHLPTGITVVATERRSQHQNLEAALERLEEKIRRHFYRPPSRKPTHKTRGSDERRIQAKKVRSAVKRDRRRSFED